VIPFGLPENRAGTERSLVAFSGIRMIAPMLGCTLYEFEGAKTRDSNVVRSRRWDHSGNLKDMATLNSSGVQREPECASRAVLPNETIYCLCLS